MTYMTVETTRIPLVEAVTLVRDAIRRGAGGRLVLLDRALRKPSLSPRESARAGAQHGTVVLAAPRRSVWTSWLRLRRMPARVSPVNVADALCSACLVDGRRVFLIGGEPGGRGVPSGALRAAAVLGLRYPGLRIAGALSPSTNPDEWTVLIEEVIEAKPDVVLVSLREPSSPSARVRTGLQEELIAELRAALPGAWVFGSPGLIDAVVGDAPSRSRFARLLGR
jgi:hypothetical protein